MVRHYTLIPEDLDLINRRRGDPNRLGFALMLCYMRFPGRVLQQGEQPPTALCAFVAEQLASILCNSAITVREIRLAENTFLRFKLPSDFAP